jgi:hypothetical protein
MQRRPKRIFICHRKVDHPTAFALQTACKKHYTLGGDGEVFMDTEEILPGDKFPERITRGVSECDVFFALIGPSWKKQIQKLAIEKIDYVRIEMAQALSEQKLIVPVLIGGADPPKSNEVHWEVRPLLEELQIATLPLHYREADLKGLLSSVEEAFANSEQRKEIERLDKISPAPGLLRIFFEFYF